METLLLFSIYVQMEFKLAVEFGGVYVSDILFPV